MRTMPTATVTSIKPVLSEEPVFTTLEVAARLKVSKETARKFLVAEYDNHNPGVLSVSPRRRLQRGKSTRLTLRIRASALAELEARLSR